MAIENRITFQELPRVEQSSEYADEEREVAIPYPEGEDGWKLAYSFRGELNIAHVWQKGGIQYDRGYENTWTCRGDDVLGNSIGEGANLVIENTTGTSEKEVVFEFIPGDVYLFGGAVSWENAGAQDGISLEVIATATDVTVGGSQTVNIVNNKIVPVDAGTGTHEISGIPTVVDNKTHTGYWKLENGQLVEAPNQDGNLDLYTVDMTVARLVNRLATVPSTNHGHSFHSDNAWRILYGYKFRFKCHNVSNTNWNAALTLAMFRKKTIDY